MIKSKLHTFREIINHGIWVQSEEDPAQGEYRKISSLYVPKIQRDYAQGRKSETEIRRDFLDDIFDSLDRGSDMELSFIFGSRQSLAVSGHQGFEILDGQQRLTTLFLIYWYVGMREGGMENIPDPLEMFDYETRDTSSDFIRRITQLDKQLALSEDKHPSEIIKNRKWFTDEYLCDPTVTAMLGMLDDIHLKYNSLGESLKPLYPRLSHLKFYVLMLEKFEMTDELYIKMNSRGLSLTAFENFKASLVKYMKSSEEYKENLFWFDFATKIDAVWIDLFWKYLPGEGLPGETLIDIDDKSIGQEYLRFFNRYFFNKSALSQQADKTLEPVTNLLYKNDEEAMPGRLTHWNDVYIPLFNGVPSLFRKLYKVFDELHDNLEVYIGEIRKDPFGNLDNFLDNLLSNNTKDYKFTLHHRVAFGVMTEFIEAIPDDMSIRDAAVLENFRRICRMLFNVVENTPIETTVPAISVISGFSEILSLPHATDGNIYEVLASNPLSSNNFQLKEEKMKVGKICEGGNFNPVWEASFSRAERHPFFKGYVGFFLDDSLSSPAELDARYDVMKDMFDAGGISAPMRNNGHLLIRAIFSRLTTWEKLKGRRITEKKEPQNFLKNLIRDNSGIHDMFRDFFRQEETSDMETYLKNVIDAASPGPDETEETGRMFRRLTYDDYAPAIFDWIAATEGNDKNDIFRVHPYYYMINRPGKWHQYLVFNTERNLLIPPLAASEGLDISEAPWNDELNDYTEKHVTVFKTLHDVDGREVRLKLLFNEWKQLFYYLPLALKDSLLATGAITEDKIKNDNIEFCWEWYGNADPQSIKAISDKISEIASLVSSLRIS